MYRFVGVTVPYIKRSLEFPLNFPGETFIAMGPLDEKINGSGVAAIGGCADFTKLEIEESQPVSVPIREKNKIIFVIDLFITHP
jgi:hypothetical protein